MADPPTPVTPDQAQILDQVTSSQTALNNAQTDYNNIAEQSSSILDSFKSKMEASGFSLNNLGRITAEQSSIFIGLGSAIVTANQNLSDFTGIDTSKTMTFTGQLKDLRDMLGMGGVAGANAQTVLEGLKKKFIDMGGAPELLAKAVAKGSDAVLGLVKNMFTHADRALASEDAMLQMAAATGQLGAMMEKAGNNMEMMNTLLDENNNMMDQAKGATNSNNEQIQKYYMSLAKVPGAFNEVVRSGTLAGGTMSMLTATIKLAHGTHRDFDQVVQDLNHSMIQYGVGGEAALSFTSRMTELSNKFQVPLEDMRNNLMGATDAFKNMTNAGEAAGRMQQGISEIMNTYVGRLKDAGMTGRQAAETVKGMTDELSKLGTAQKAFLSAQTGGPGGLMGAFQIEKLIQEGNIAEVQKKVMQTMQRQFGRVVTLDEASKSQAAASQLERQVLMLKQGPMGSLIKTDQDAFKFLDAMKAQQEGKPPVAGGGGLLDPQGLQKTIKDGSTWEQKSFTQVSTISKEVSSIRHRLETMSLGTVQRAVTGAATPESPRMTPAQRKVQETLEGHMREAEVQSGQDAEALANNMKTVGTLQANRLKTHLQKNVNNLVRDIGEAPETVKSGIETFKEGVKLPGSGPATGRAGVLSNIEEQRRAPSAFNEAAKMQMQSTQQERQILAAKRINEPVSPGATLATAPRMAPTIKPPGAAAPTTGGIIPEVNVSKEGPSGRIHIDVNVKVHEADQSKAITPAT